MLSMDGGGVRGLFSLMVLSKLMKNVALEEKRLGTRAQNVHTPLESCDDFDPAGTSTGGLIAIMLSRLRLNIIECKRRQMWAGKSSVATIAMQRS
jgi:patatin-like phospholipase/acyl hydrolase